MAKITFETITGENVELLDDVEPKVFGAPIRHDFVKGCLSNPNQFLIVAVTKTKKKRRVVGKAIAFVFHFPEKPSEIYIEEIDVAKKWRRKGVATGLMDAVGEEGKARGIAEYWLITEHDNKGARKLYEGKAHSRQKSVWYEFYC